MSSQTPELPILDAYAHRDALHLIAWCDECRRWHFHDLMPKSGPVAAFCHSPQSAYRPAGYVLRLMGPAPRWINQDLQRQSRGTQKGPYDLVQRRSW